MEIPSVSTKRYNRWDRPQRRRRFLLRGLLLLLNFTGTLRLVMKLMLDRRVPWRLKVLLPAAISYIVLPIDLVPDFLVIVGRVDDLVVLILAIVLFLGFAPRDIVMEHRGRGSSNTTDKPKQSKSVIEGEYRVIDDEN